MVFGARENSLNSIEPVLVDGVREILTLNINYRISPEYKYIELCVPSEDCFRTNLVRIQCEPNCQVVQFEYKNKNASDTVIQSPITFKKQHVVSRTTEPNDVYYMRYEKLHAHIDK